MLTVPWSRDLGPVSYCGQFYVEDSDAQLLAPLGHILDSQYGSVSRGLISVSLYLHPTNHIANGFLARKIATWTSVMEKCEEVADNKCIFSFGYLRSEADDCYSFFSFPL